MDIMKDTALEACIKYSKRNFRNDRRHGTTPEKA